MAFFERFLRKNSPPQGARRVTTDLFDEDFLRQLESLALMSRRAASGGRRGEHRSRKKGSGVEFADHRNYTVGDDIRFLDLGVYQRFGKLLLRLFEEEEDLSLFFLIDNSLSMGVNDAAKLNQAARVAAALAYVGLSGLDRVSVCTLTDQVSQRLAPTRGKQRVFRILRFLSEMKAEGSTDLGQALKNFVAQNKRRGVAVLLSDLFDPAGFEAGINVLRFNRFEPVVLQLTDERDQRAESAGDLQLFDIESGRSREVSMTPALLEQMKAAYDTRNQQIESFCARRGVAHFRVEATQAVDEVVLAVLRRGGLVG